MWGRALRKVASSTTEYENETLARAAKECGCQTLADCRPRDVVVLQGRIHDVTLSPRGTRSWLEAEVTDGTGSVKLVWIGRRTIRGIEAGRMIRVRGRLTRRRREPVLYNPAYDLLS